MMSKRIKNSNPSDRSKPVGHFDYDYVGRCRCGFGPNAFYRMSNGKTIHASQISYQKTKQRFEQEEEIRLIKLKQHKDKQS